LPFVVLGNLLIADLVILQFGDVFKIPKSPYPKISNVFLISVPSFPLILGISGGRIYNSQKENSKFHCQQLVWEFGISFLCIAIS
jgi:hypothetical protein